MNSKIKSVVCRVHSGIGDLFPSMKTDAIRRINRHPGLSNALRSAAGIEPIEAPVDEPSIGVIQAFRQDTSRLAQKVIVSRARSMVNDPTVRQTVLPYLDKVPRLRAWLKRSVFAPPPVAEENIVTDIRCLTRRGLMIYGMLTALEQRGED